jgi:NAD(P)-dependent dehydrogenase (short-subunit alcohol dehydrogenase family)
MTEVQREDAERIATSELVPWEDFDGATVVVTGATGLIGKALVGTLLERERRVGAGTRVVALVRNVRKACELFGEPACLEVVPWDAWRPI